MAKSAIDPTQAKRPRQAARRDAASARAAAATVELPLHLVAFALIAAVESVAAVRRTRPACRQSSPAFGEGSRKNSEIDVEVLRGAHSRLAAHVV
jgi:hypothetical protein